MEIPERMKKFPLWRGFPVHFTVFIGPDGNPDFKVIHTKRVTEAANKNLCFLCGERLTLPFAFIGGPQCMKHHHFIDGPMHLECATYAAKTCPYLANADHGHSKVAPKHAETADITTIKESAFGRPDRIGLALTNTYTVVKADGIRFKAGEWISIDWDIMPKRAT